MNSTPLHSPRLFLSAFGLGVLMFMQTAVAQSSNSPINVDAIFPSQTSTNISLTLTGTVEAKENAELAPLAEGRVAQILVEVGDIVKKDQVLLVLNSKLAELEVAGAAANVNALQVNELEANRLLNEAMALSQQQLVPQTLIGERRALLANSQAQLTRAKATLSLQQEILNRHTLRAPFSGVIALRNTDLGEWISQQTSVFTLVANNNLRLSIAIPQEYYSRLAGQKDLVANIFPSASTTDYTQTTLSRFVPVSDPTTRSFLGQIDLPASIDLAAGMSARVEILLPNSASTSIVLPRSAVKQHPDGGSSVFTVNNGKAQRIITPYTLLDNNTVAIANQPANVAYILTAIELLQDGTPVNATIVEGSR